MQCCTRRVLGLLESFESQLQLAVRSSALTIEVFVQQCIEQLSSLVRSLGTQDFDGFELRLVFWSLVKMREVGLDLGNQSASAENAIAIRQVDLKEA